MLVTRVRLPACAFVASVVAAIYSISARSLLPAWFTPASKGLVEGLFIYVLRLLMFCGAVTNGHGTIIRGAGSCCKIRCSIVVSISACHAEDPGSIPGGGVIAAATPFAVIPKELGMRIHDVAPAASSTLLRRSFWQQPEQATPNTSHCEQGVGA